MLLILHLRFAGSHIDRVRLLEFLSGLRGLAFKGKDAKGKGKETVEVGAPSPSVIKLVCFFVACCVL